MSALDKSNLAISINPETVRTVRSELLEFTASL